MHQRQDLPKIIAAIGQGKTAPVYLLVGERFLCQEAANELIAALLPDPAQREARLTVIDGEREDPAQTLARLRTYSLFGGRQVVKVVDSRLLYSKTVAKTLWDKAEKARDQQDGKEAARHLTAMLGLAGLGPAAWQADNLAELAASQWQKLFGFGKPAETGWVAELLDQAEEGAAGGAGGREEAADLFQQALEKGLPRDNILLLLAEAVDKRKKLFKFLDKEAVVIDLSVESGSSGAARKSQDAVLTDLIKRTLAGFGKTIRPDAIPLLLERIGFQPVAVVMETEKLALYSGERTSITKADLDAMIGRTREEAIYELTEAWAGGRLDAVLGITARLQEGGMHPLAILGGLRNHLRKLMVVEAIRRQPEPSYRPGLPFNLFQQQYLPSLKESRGELPAALAGHPYVAYKLFEQAAAFSGPQLRRALAALLRAEYRLKGSGLPEKTVLTAFLFETTPRR